MPGATEHLRGDPPTAMLSEPLLLRRLFERLEHVPLRAVAVALFLFSLALRLFYRNAGLFLYDSVELARAVERSFETWTLHGQINGRHGSVLLNLILYVPYRLATGVESAEATVILTNILLGSVAVAALYGLGLELLARRPAARFGALAAALTYSVSPVFLSVTTYGKPHGMEVCLVVGAFFLAAPAPGRRSRLRTAAASALFGVAVLCREASLLYLPLYVLLALRPGLQRGWPWLRLPRPVWRADALLAAFGPLLALGGVAWWAFLGDVVQRTLFEPGMATVSFASLLSPVPALWRSFSDLAFDLSPLGIVLAAAGFCLLWVRSDDRLAAVFLLAWAASLLLVGNSRAYWPRLLAVVTPPFFLWIGVALGWLYARVRILGSVLAIALGLVLFLRIEPVVSYRSHVSGEKDHALWLKRSVPPDSVILVMDDWIFIDYYAGLETRRHPVDDPVAMRAFMAEVKELVVAGRPVYVVESAFAYDLSGNFRRMLLANFRLRKVGTKVMEDFHRSALTLNVYPSRLFRLELRQPGA